MKILFLATIASILSITNGQYCRATLDEAIQGQCSTNNNCQGSILAVQSCEQGGQCCINGNLTSIPSECITANDFDVLYNTSRATFLRKVLNYGISSAGICNHCRAKAAFLAIAATMTNSFQTDEATGTSATFSGDDMKYGNNQTGDGSRFRRRGFFGLRGREMYARLQALRPQYQSLDKPESVVLTQNAIDIASLLWSNPDLRSGSSLTQYADGTFYGFSMLWYKLTGGIEQLSNGTKYYSQFLRQLKCGGDLYPGQGPACQYNATVQGRCSADCIKGLEDAGEFCGCSGNKAQQCADSPGHVRCCLDSCSQELKMDLGFVLDASGSIAPSDYEVQRSFTKDLLCQVNVGRNKTHVGIINYSTEKETLTWLDNNYSLQEKLQQVDRAQHFGASTYTAEALQQANTVFSYARGLRRPEDGAPQVIFVITDGVSNDPGNTIEAAAVLKNRSITIISVGVGSGPNLVELHAVCTPPASENYFAISDYSALQQRISQFTSRSCSEPAVITPNTTITGEVGKNKYKFLKIKVVVIGNKILIKVKLLNGVVKVFHSFTSHNPKDPEDFIDYGASGTKTISHTQSSAKNARAEDDEISVVIDKPNSNAEYVYLGVKGVEENNKFDVKFDDCDKVDCNPKSTSSVMQTNMILFLLSATIFFFNFIA